MPYFVFFSGSTSTLAPAIWSSKLRLDKTGYLSNFEISKYKDEFEVKSSDEISNDSEVLNKISDLESEIEILRRNLKKESNIGTKVELNVKIKKLQKKIIELKSNLI